MKKNKEIMNVENLREILAEEIVKLRSGETTPAAINAITNATGKIFSSVKLEMEYAKLIGAKPEISFINVKESEKKRIEKKEN